MHDQQIIFYLIMRNWNLFLTIQSLLRKEWPKNIQEISANPSSNVALPNWTEFLD